jgi:hypothetical protein
MDPFMFIHNLLNGRKADGTRTKYLDDGANINAAVALVGGLVILGILGWVGLEVMQQVSDQTQLKQNDTFYNASVDFTSAISTGFSWQKIIIIVVVAAVVISVLYTSGLLPQMEG